MAPSQVAMLGRKATIETWKDENMRDSVCASLNRNISGGLRNFEPIGTYFYSTAHPSANLGTAHIGSFRVRYFYAPCGPTTVLAQQINDDGTYTFRKWNPRMKDAKVGEDNTAHDTVQRNWCMTCLWWCFCPYCAIAEIFGDCASCCCRSVGGMGEEVINLASECHEPAGNLLKRANERARKAACCLRPCGISFLIFGFYCLLVPILTLSIPGVDLGPLMAVSFGGGFALAIALGWNIGAFTMIFGWLRYNLLPS